MNRTRTALTALAAAASLAAAAPAAHADAPVIPYEQAPSGIVWDSYPLASTEHETRVRPSALAIFAAPTIDGVYDDNIGLMTGAGRAGMARKGFKRLRLLVQYPTKPGDAKVDAAMREAARYGMTVLLAVRVVQPAPKSAAYGAWLRSMLHAYPRISAVEAANEPEWTGLTVNQAVKYYRTAKRVSGKRDVLAGGFTDSSDTWDFAEYARKAHATLYALHAYVNVWRNRLPRLRQMIRMLGAKHVWITETGAMTAYDNETFTADEQIAQAKRIVQLSKWSIVQHVYWTGWQSCIGCQPTATDPRTS